jgi:hypothetical protein
MLNTNLSPNSSRVNALSLADLFCWLTDAFGDEQAEIIFNGVLADGKTPNIVRVGLDDSPEYFFEYDMVVNGRVVTVAGYHTATGLARMILESEAVVSFTCYECVSNSDPLTVGFLANNVVLAEDELDELFARKPVYSPMALFSAFPHFAAADLPY